ncbi:MAG: hypothetical protein IPQ19_07170 [Bacteroidetes bacterium]|nr:hypothetical protein [Bacteroidota bacterium]
MIEIIQIDPIFITWQYWEYDAGELSRRWNVDPVLKHYESPFATFVITPLVLLTLMGMILVVLYTGTCKSKQSKSRF